VRDGAFVAEDVHHIPVCHLFLLSSTAATAHDFESTHYPNFIAFTQCEGTAVH
jgi:hypothetical protein